MYFIDCSKFLNRLFSLNRLNGNLRLESFVIVFTHSELYASFYYLCKKASCPPYFYSKMVQILGLGIVVSSRIEGTKTNIEEAFFEENEIDPRRGMIGKRLLITLKP